MRKISTLLCLGTIGLSLVGCGEYEADDPDPVEAPVETGADTAATGPGTPDAPVTGGGGAPADPGTPDAPVMGGGGAPADPGTPDAPVMGGGGAPADPGAAGGRVDPPTPSCENVQACGGDALGVWFAVGSCLSVDGAADLRGLGIGCSEGTATGELQVSGNWSVTNDEGTQLLTDTTQTTGQIVLGLGSECLDVSGTRVGCADVAGPLRSAGFESTECVASATIPDGCDCTGVVNQTGAAGFVTFDIAPAGLWETEGSTLTFTGYETVDYDYCVDGDFMHVSVATVNPNGAVTGTIVLQRQP